MKMNTDQSVSLYGLPNYDIGSSYVFNYSKEDERTDRVLGSFLHSKENLSRDDEEDFYLRSDDHLNLTLLIANVSLGHPPLDYSLLRRFELNLRLSNIKMVSLISAYFFLFSIGCFGNYIVVSTFIKSNSLRTARNIFIVNLAISDLLLCCVTIPLTLVEVLTIRWPAGDLPFTCKIFGLLQGVPIFVSSLSICAIAIDRNRVIVYPTKGTFRQSGVLLTLPFIWITAIMIALPSYFCRHLNTHPLPFNSMPSVSFCFEKWDNSVLLKAYSCLVFLMQMIIPLLTVSICYLQVWKRVSTRIAREKEKRHRLRSKLRKKMINKGIDSERQIRTATDQVVFPDPHRVSKTMWLLMSIAIIYSVSWLPINLYNLILDISSEIYEGNEVQIMFYALCHILGMSSACSNPILYGWHNSNFRREFLKHSRFLRYLSRNLPCRRIWSRRKELSCRVRRKSRTTTGHTNDTRQQDERDTEFISMESKFKNRRASPTRSKENGSKKTSPDSQDKEFQTMEEMPRNGYDNELTNVSSNGGYIITVL